MIFFWFWSFCAVIIYLTRMLPGWRFNTICTSIHFSFWCVYCLEWYCIQICLSQFRCLLEPKNFLRGHHPPKSPAEGLRASPTPLVPATLAFLLIMFTPGIMYVFYLILFLAGFSDIHPGHNKMPQDKSVQQRKVIYFVSLSNKKGAAIYKT